MLQDELRQLTSTLSAERTAAAKAAAQQKRSSEELLARKEVSPNACDSQSQSPTHLLFSIPSH